jgi:hypothetical protein
MGEDYTIFTKLLAADQTVHGGRDRLPREGYSTLYWAPGEIVTDPFGVPVDADAPEGIYYLNIGLYKQVGAPTTAGTEALSLPLVQDGQLIEASSINIGPIKIGKTPPGWTLQQADPEVPLNQPLGQGPNLTLLGYDLSGSKAAGVETDQPFTTLAGLPATLHLTLYWRSEAPLEIDYTTFVHVRNEAGEIVAQKDQPPLEGRYPTSLWNPGEILASQIVVPMPSKLPPGRYDIVIGLYDFRTDQRLNVPDNPANEVQLTRVTISSD